MSTNRQLGAAGINGPDIFAHGPRRRRFRIQRKGGIVTELHRRDRGTASRRRDHGIDTKVGHGIVGRERHNGTIEQIGRHDGCAIGLRLH
jgi:hypothetical protein